MAAASSAASTADGRLDALSEAQRRFRGQRWSASLAFSLTLGAGRLAMAQPASDPLSTEEMKGTAAMGLILLARTEGDEGVITHLRAELEQSEWRTLEIRLDPRLAQPPLAELARQQAAAAALRVDRARGTVELWIARAVGAATEVLGTPGEYAPDAVLALRASETLRARGLALPPEPSRPDHALPSRTAQPTPAPRARDVPRSETENADVRRGGVWLGIGPAALVSHGGLGPTVQVSAAVRWEFTRGWSLAGRGFIPLSGARVEAREGRAEVRIALAGAGLDATLLQTGAVQLTAGAGAGVAWLSMEGQPSAGYVGEPETLATAIVFGHWAARIPLVGALNAHAAVLAGSALPRAAVHFAGRTVATWGQPYATFSLGLELGLFTKRVASPFRDLRQ